VNLHDERNGVHCPPFMSAPDPVFQEHQK
jgi:hypothetical protein